MRTKIILLLALIVSYFFYAQISPSIKINNNPYNNIKLDSVIIDNTKYYETLNYFDYDRISKKLDSINIEQNLLIKKIRTESSPSKNAALRTQLEIQKQQSVIFEKEKDSLYIEYVKDYLDYKKATFGFWESRSTALFDLIYSGKHKKRFDFLTNTGINIGNNTGSVYAEIVSGHMYLFRVSLGTMVASSSSTNDEEAKQQEAYQRLVTYGGNTVLNLEYPLIYAHTSNNQCVLLTRLLIKGTADFPQFGTASDNWAGSGSVGLDLYADVATSNNKIRFFANANIGQYYATGTFQKNLALERNKFSFGQVKLGVTFNNISLSFIVATVSSESILRNKNVIAGGQILP